MPVTLADIELTGIQHIDTHETRALVEHRIPGLEGDLIQDPGRRPAAISFEGIFKGEEALDHIEILRQKFKDREAVVFVSDITDSTDVTDVVIENLKVYQVSGKPSYYTYAISLKEFVDLAEGDVKQEIEHEQEREANETYKKKEKQVEDGIFTLEVAIDLEDRTTEYTDLRVLVYNEQDEIITIIDKETNGIYTAENIPAGKYHTSVERNTGENTNA